MSDTHAAARGSQEVLSCEYLFFEAKKRETTPPTKGASTTAVREALEHDGQPLESGWEYLPALPKNLAEWAPPATVGTVFQRVSSILTGGFAAAWNAVEGDTSVMVVLSISDAFYQPDGDGVIESGEAVDPTRRHAVVAVATGERTGAKYLLVRNSWGGDWGTDGHAWLAESYLTPRIIALATVN